MNSRRSRGWIAVLALLAPLLAARPSQAQSLTLNDVVRLALAKNERSRIADLSVVTADAAVTRARAGFLPSLTLSGSETLRPGNVDQAGRTVLRSNSASGQLTLNQPLLTATAFPLYASAKHGFEAARHGALDQRRQLSFDAARAFFSVVAQERLLTAARGRLERAQANLNDTRARAVAQIASTNDVTRSEIDEATARQNVASAEGSVEQARVSLEYVTDAQVEGPIEPLAASLVPATLDLPSLSGQAVATRPDLAQARENAASASASADEPPLRLIPVIGAAAQARLADQTIAGDRYYDTTLTLNLTWSIWDAGQRGADTQSRNAAAETSDLQARALHRKVEADVRSAVAELSAARRALEAANASVEAARKSAEETRILYSQGLARAIELVDANLSRYDAEVALAGAELGLRQAELDLRAALGLFPIDGVK